MHSIPPFVFRFPARVYWGDTDAGGVVYHAQYLVLLERARSEWLRALGYGQVQLNTEHNLVFAVRSMQLDFLKPARLDDALDVTVECTRCRHASLSIAQRVEREGEHLLHAGVKLAALTPAFTPRAIPSFLRELISPLQTPRANS